MIIATIVFTISGIQGHAFSVKGIPWPMLLWGDIWEPLMARKFQNTSKIIQNNIALKQPPFCNTVARLQSFTRGNLASIVLWIPPTKIVLNRKAEEEWFCFSDYRNFHCFTNEVLSSPQWSLKCTTSKCITGRHSLRGRFQEVKIQ